jgi:hypothetical protein
MNLRVSRARFLAAATASLAVLSAAVLVPGTTRAQAPADPPEAVMKKMMEALRSKSHDAFLGDCDETMRAALSKEQFEGVASMMAPSLQPGYKTTYLGKLRQKGHDVHLWRLTPATVKDETLIRLSIKDKKVSGFFLQ